MPSTTDGLVTVVLIYSMPKNSQIQSESLAPTPKLPLFSNGTKNNAKAESLVG
jgi:hypothetical protein